MSGERRPTITDADIRSLAAKLKGLHALLIPPEQALLHTLLRRAAAPNAERDADTEGFLWGVSFDPFVYLDTIDFGAAEPGTAPRQSDRRAPGTNH